MKFFYFLLLCSLVFQWTYCILRPYLKYIKPKIKADDLELLRPYKYMAKGLIGGYIIGALQHGAAVNLRPKTPVSVTFSLGKHYQDKLRSQKNSRNFDWENEDDCEDEREKKRTYKSKKAKEKESGSTKHIIINENRSKPSIFVESSDIYPMNRENVDNSNIREGILEKIEPFDIANQKSEQDIDVEPNAYSLSKIYTYKDLTIPLYDSNFAESKNDHKFTKISINNEDKEKISDKLFSNIKRFDNWKDIGAYESKSDYDEDKKYLRNIDFSKTKDLTERNDYFNANRSYDIDNNNGYLDYNDDHPEKKNNNSYNSDNEKRIYDNNADAKNSTYNSQMIRLNNNNDKNFNDDSISLNLTKQSFKDKLKIEKLIKEREMAQLEELKEMVEIEKRKLMKIIKKTHHHVLEEIKRQQEMSSQSQDQPREIKFNERLKYKRFPRLRTYRRSYFTPPSSSRDDTVKTLVRMETVRLGPTPLVLMPPLKNCNPSFLQSSIPLHSSFIHSQPISHFPAVNL